MLGRLTTPGVREMPGRQEPDRATVQLPEEPGVGHVRPAEPTHQPPEHHTDPSTPAPGRPGAAACICSVAARRRHPGVPTDA